MAPDHPIACDNCAAWNQPRAPFLLFGNAWYVGPQGLSSVVIATSGGLVLLDGGLPQSAPVIEANLAAAGFRVADVRYVLISHTHFDHVGGVAAIAAASGAVVVAGAPAAEALARGRPTRDDPQFPSTRFPKVEDVRPIADGETLVVGDVTITAHRTPGHTPGGTSWTWRSCDRDRCLDLVYADSLNPVSSEGYRFADHPDVVAALRASAATVAGLPCDLLVSVHPDGSGLFDRLARRDPPGTAPGDPDALIDPNGCRDYAAAAVAKLDKRLADEAAR